MSHLNSILRALKSFYLSLKRTTQARTKYAPIEYQPVEIHNKTNYYKNLRVDTLMNINSKIFIAGSEKLIPGALTRKIANKGYSNLLTAQDLDLTDQNQVNNFFKTNRPEYVFLSGGS